MALSDELLAIERELWTGGPDRYQAHLDVDCTFAFTEMAGTSTREEVAALAEEGRWSDLEFEVEALSQPTDDVAVLVYRASGQRTGGERHLARVSSGYVVRDGDWKMMFHAQTPLSG